MWPFCAREFKSRNLTGVRPALRYAIAPILVVLTLLTEPMYGGAAIPISEEDLSRAWHARTDRINTVRMSWSETRWIRRGSIDIGQFAGAAMNNVSAEQSPSTDVTLSYACRLDIDGDKFRFEYDGPEWDVNSRAFVNCRHVGVWDGKTGKCFQGTERLPTGSVGDYCEDLMRPHLVPMRIAFRMMNPLWYNLDFNQYDFSDRSESFEGSECLILQTPNSHVQQKLAQGRHAWRMRYLIDPARDNSVLAVSRSKDGMARAAEDYRISYRRDASGIWYPSHWTITLDSHDPPNTIVEGNVTECVLNKESRPALYEYEFPSGAMVRDDRTKELYIARGGGTKRLVTEAERLRNTSYEELLATESGEAVTRRSGRRGSQGWIAIGAVALACVGFVVFYLKRRARFE